jgi:hypothetical protein
MAIGRGPYGDGDAGYIVITSNGSAIMDQRKALRTKNVRYFDLSK